MNPATELRKTPLNAVHRQLGARMVDFGGWDMPVQYAGLVQEHMAVRTRAGVFDVSHMGEIEISGHAGEETIQKVTCNDVSMLAIGQCQYSALTTPAGTFVDDILVYRLGEKHFFLCVNAANQEKDFQWIRDNAASGVDVVFRSNDFAQIAVQGPLRLPDSRAANRYPARANAILLVCSRHLSQGWNPSYHARAIRGRMALKYIAPPPMPRVSGTK